MGVLYVNGDDLRELLLPFVAEKGCRKSAEEVEHFYNAASLGKLTAAEFWRAIGLDPILEDEYLEQHRLVSETHDMLDSVRDSFDRIGCLSNDISEWSLKLRRRFALESRIECWYISGDMEWRKPSVEIYRMMLGRLGVKPAEVIFVDDRQKNVSAAEDLGITSVLFGQQIGGTESRHAATDMRSLVMLLREGNLFDEFE